MAYRACYISSSHSAWRAGSICWIGYICNSNSDKTDKKKEIERIKVIGNPWYPNNEGIFRRMFDIPFGMMMIDEKEVGIELVNRNDPQNFFAGILIKDERLAINIKEFYHKMWDSASDEDNSSSNGKEKEHY